MSLGKAMSHSRKPKVSAQGRAVPHELSELHEGWPGQRVSSAYTMQKPVLVLNASYEPINICGARRALVLVLKGVARTEEEQGDMLHAARYAIAMPSVIRLIEYRRIPHQTRALSRKNILLRDRNSCQYCGVVLPPASSRSTTCSAIARRSLHLGEPRRLLPHLQPQQGQPDTARVTRHEAYSRAAPLHAAHHPPHYADDRRGRREMA